MVASDELLTTSCALLLQLERERLRIGRELEAQLSDADRDPRETARTAERLVAVGRDLDALRTAIEAIRRRLLAERRLATAGAAAHAMPCRTA